MKSSPRLFAILALALGTALASAQEGGAPPPKPPGAPKANGPANGPGLREAGRGDRRENPRMQDRDRRPEEPRDERGERRPDNARRSESPDFAPMTPPAPPQPTRYVGVMTSQVPPELAAQLGLAEGFGLLVNDLLPNSPAAQAGVQKWDVLTRFNDQQLVSAEQFATLVRAEARDAEASLTLLRKAQEQKLSVKIGEKLLPERRSFPGGGDWPREMDRWKNSASDMARRLQERMKDYADKMRAYEEQLKEFQERLRNWQKNPSDEAPKMPPAPAVPELGSVPTEPGVPPSDILREVRPGGAAQIRMIQPQGGVIYNTGSAKFLMKDEQGEIEISNVDGKRVLVAKDPRGEIIFEGPIDTEEQRAALPESVREKIKRIDVRVNTTPHRPAPFPTPDRGPSVQ